jgi:hypothetical protein
MILFLHSEIKCLSLLPHIFLLAPCSNSSTILPNSRSLSERMQTNRPGFHIIQMFCAPGCVHRSLCFGEVDLWFLSLTLTCNYLHTVCMYSHYASSAFPFNLILLRKTQTWITRNSMGLTATLSVINPFNA